MKELFLLRHAKSAWGDPEKPDIERPLSGRGRKAAKAVARYLIQHRLRPALVLCSSARRTRETLDRLAEALGAVDLAVERDLYLAEASDLLERLRRIPDRVPSVLVIGHNPGLHELAVEIAQPEGRRQLADKFPTAALARFALAVDRWAELGPGRARLVAFVRPAELEG